MRTLRPWIPVGKNNTSQESSLRRRLVLLSAIVLLAPLVAGSARAESGWTNLNPPASPSQRVGHAIAYDSRADRMLMFGGNTGDSIFSIVDETWSFDFETNAWTNLNPTISPSPRVGHAMAYDSRADRMIVFGGASQGAFVGDTWAYDFNTNVWANLNPTISPSPRSGHAMAYDSQADRPIVFGGGTQGGFVSDTWAYDFNTNVWANLSSLGHPSARILHSMVYDSLSARTVIFGGYASDVHWTNQTWAYAYFTNTWTNLTPAASPSPRVSHAMAYNVRSDRTILFGGDISVLTGNNETWSYDLDANVWTEMHPTTSPPARAEHAMVYDTRADRILMFGGRFEGPADPGGTWSYPSGRSPSPGMPWVPLLIFTAILAGVPILYMVWRRRRKRRSTSSEG